MKICAIGDVHGHFDQLMELMEDLTHNHDIDYREDIMVFLGDNVDGGPDTKKVLDWMLLNHKRYPHWKFLYGNHEDLMLDALDPKHPVYGDYYLWWSQGGRETLESYSREIDGDEYQKSIMQPLDILPQEHLDFIKEMETWYETENYFFVHGGIVPGWSIEWCKKKMTRYDMIWMREPFLESNFNWGKKIIFGHTIQWSRDPKKHLQPFIMKNKIGIDTFAHNKGRLTAIILPEEKIVQTEFTSDATIKKVKNSL